MEPIFEPIEHVGIIKEVTDIGVTVNIKGRLGVIKVPLRYVISDKPIEVGQEVRFYFSYLHVKEQREEK
jgi:hypothetical protein